ncbi:MAG: hypothetical protein PUA77_04870 [Lachnospiraceae bacterium]|nr:hypothetical protein [Agathobacter sp.]MDD6291108.1 hypothetical protein [Lachnospiraceae bacterium]
MGVKATGTVGSQTDVYTSYGMQNSPKAETSDVAAKTEEGVVYEKAQETPETSKKATYSINKMSSEDRAALVKQLQADQESRQQQLVSIVQQMMNKQAVAYTNANDMWKFLAKGDFTVDEQTKLQAQQDISEDGYYGVKQTSERLFDFACALAGDDVDKMKEMQQAMAKGFKQATEAWGKDLPDICQQTLDAANKKFEEYYATKNESSQNLELEA